MAPRFLVTGVMGCLGAWTARRLLDEGIEVVGLDLSTDDHRLRLLLSDEELGALTTVQADVTDPESVVHAVGEYDITHIVHLAALQVPFCKADPVAGARVNVVGTVNVFEAALAHRQMVHGLAYASSIAVFGPSDLYDGVAADDDRPAPTTVYGVYKVANEGTARVYAQDHGLGSIGLRPHIVYGPGRDQGLTSSATAAMLAAAAGRRHHISHGGAGTFQYAPDAAAAFIAAAQAAPGTAEVVNLGGPTVSVPQIIDAIEHAAPEVRGKITFERDPLPFPPTVTDDGLQRVLGGFNYTGIQDGVADSIDRFRKLLAEGKVTQPA